MAKLIATTHAQERGVATPMQGPYKVVDQSKPLPLSWRENFYLEFKIQQ